MKNLALLIGLLLFVFSNTIAQPAKTGGQPFVFKATVFKKDTINILKHGAKPDGVTLNTSSINAAISECNKKGGGVVLVPAGVWLTGPIEIKSNVNLHLQKNALLQFTEDHSQYKLVEGNWEGLPQMRNQSPLYANNATNIAVTGLGIVDGAGQSWRAMGKDRVTEREWNNLVASGGVVSEDGKIWSPSESYVKGNKIREAGVLSPEKTPEFYNEIKDYLRPNLLVFTRCKGILLEGVTFQNSAAWCLHPLMSEDITIRDVKVRNLWNAANGDAIDIESCKNVILENSIFDAGDDGICIKSGRDEAGRKRNMPTENLYVNNCTVYRAHGGFVIGSEMSGGAKNIIVENCTFIGTDIGLRFKTTRGRGGVVENIMIKNIFMKDIVNEAIFFDMYYMIRNAPASADKNAPPKMESAPVSEATPQFKNIYVKNVVCRGAKKGLFVRGLPEMNINNIMLEDMTLQADKGVEITEGSDIYLKDIRLVTKDTNPVVNVYNSKNIMLQNIGYNPGADLFMNISGEKTGAIMLTQTDIGKAKKGVQFTYGANEKVLTVK